MYPSGFLFARSQTAFFIGLKDTINVIDFGAVANDGIEDSHAFQTAIDYASKNKRVLKIPEGLYELKDVQLRSNTTVIGEGDKTVLKKIFSGIYAVGCNFSYTSPQNDPIGKLNIKNIRLTNLKFVGTSNIDGFSEHKHLLNLNGVENVLISNCFFNAFNGDGIYIGSDVGVERHNKNIAIEQCIFNGINKENRNAISVIDGDVVNINNNRFFNSTRANMPGAIDIEPDVFNYHVVRNITITENYFNNIGGSVGTISLVVHIPQKQLKQPVENVIISNNHIENVSNGIALFHNNTAGKNSRQHNILVVQNKVLNASGYPLGMYGVSNVTVEKNIFNQFRTNIFIGETEKKALCNNILFSKNNIERNNGDGVAISLRMVDGFVSEGNLFEDIGMAKENYGIAILGETNGTSLNVKSIRDILKGNKTTAFTAINPGHTTRSEFNEFVPSTKGMVNFFPFKKQ